MNLNKVLLNMAVAAAVSAVAKIPQTASSTSGQLRLGVEKPRPRWSQMIRSRLPSTEDST